MQMWVQGLQEVANSTFLPALEIFSGNVDEYGIDWDGPVPPDDTVDAVMIPEMFNPLSAAEYQCLTETVNPMEESREHSIDHYINTREFVLRCVSGNN
eukprot:m.6841 g.6841  ORF g.6841 m.6841 type:complete len:98 (+) comp17011_c0_seq1:1242-1535(+)